MRQFLKFFVALVIAVAVVMAIRVFAVTIYTAPNAIGKNMRTGQRVMVNKLCRDNFKKGDVFAFTVSGDAPTFALVGPPQELGEVIAVPGDTITVNKQRYLIPYKCCVRCQCHDCKLYLVNTGNARLLVHKHQIVGKILRFPK